MTTGLINQFNNRNRDREMTAFMQRQGMADNLFPVTSGNFSGSQGNYAITGSGYGQFRPDQMGAKSPDGMYNGMFYPQMRDGGNFIDNNFANTPELLGAESFNEFSNNMVSAPVNTAVDETPVSGAFKPFTPAFNFGKSENISNLKEYIINRESRGNYKALPKKKDGTLASSAVGAYQFLWNQHKDWISSVTGVKTKEDFRNNPDAQDRAWDYWNTNVLTPQAKKIKKLIGDSADLNTIKAKIHFAGAQGAMDYYTMGKETVDAFGTKTSGYAQGGEYSDAQMMAYGGQNSRGGLDLGGRVYDGTVENPFSTNRTLSPVPRSQANIEAEKGETAYGDFNQDGQLEHMNIGGKRHSQGGTPLNVPEGTFIFSDTAKMKIGGSAVERFGKSPNTKKKYTPAELAKQYDINKYQAIIDDPKSDRMAKRTAEMMIANYKRKLAELAIVQEGSKGFPQGIPDIAQEYMQQQMPMMPQQEQMPMTQPMMAMGGMLESYSLAGEVDPYTGDKLASVNPRTGKRSKDWNKSTMTQDQWNTLKNTVGYSGNSNEGLQRAIFQAYPEIVNELHDSTTGYGLPNARTMFDGKLGVRWSEIADRILSQRKPPALQTVPGIPRTAAVTPVPKITVPELKGYTPPVAGPTPGDFKPGTSTTPFDYMTPDKLSMFNSISNRANLNKYLPYIAPVTMQGVDPTFYDPTRELAANAEQANITQNFLAMTGNPQAFMANSAAVQGRAAENAANTLGRYNNMNVGLANQVAAQNAGIQNAQMQFNADRATKLYDGTVIANQQFDNAKRAGNADMLKSYINAWNNRSGLDMINATNPYFNVDPATGRQFFRSDNARRNFFGGSGSSFSNAKDFAGYEAEARALNITDPDLIKRYAFDKLTRANARYTDINGDGFPDRSTVLAPYTGLIGPYRQ
jgi:hypothetical protein